MSYEKNLQLFETRVKKHYTQYERVKKLLKKHGRVYYVKTIVEDGGCGVYISLNILDLRQFKVGIRRVTSVNDIYNRYYRVNRWVIFD